MAAKSKEAKQIEEPGNVDKIREIIFGGQMRSYERRFEDLEKEIRQSLSEVRDQLTRQVKGLDEYVKAEIDQLTERLKDEKKERLDGSTKLEEQAREAANRATEALQALDDRVSAEHRDLRSQIRAQSQSFDESLVNLRDTMKQELASLGDRLEGDKVSRSELAGFLTEMAMRLEGQFELPDA